MHGDSLAYMEMHMFSAVFLTNFDMELFETKEKSMEWLDHGVAMNVSNVNAIRLRFSVGLRSSLGHMQ